ncbi:MAG: hypothetical protein R2865_06990 [Deinococcales bacterium]
MIHTLTVNPALDITYRIANHNLTIRQGLAAYRAPKAASMLCRGERDSLILL